MRCHLAPPASHRAFVAWDASWVGGSLRLGRPDTEWELVEVGGWIT